MKSRRKYHKCDCGRLFKITPERVEKRWIVRGYDFEKYEYYIRCPSCKKYEKIKLSRLPIRIIFNLLKRKA